MRRKTKNEHAEIAGLLRAILECLKRIEAGTPEKEPEASPAKILDVDDPSIFEASIT